MRKLYTLLFACLCACGTNNNNHVINDSSSSHWSHWSKHIHDLINNEHSPIEQADSGFIKVMPYREEYVVKARWQASTYRTLSDLNTVQNKKRSYVVLGKLSGVLKGKAFILTAYVGERYENHEIYGKVLFIPFFDDSNGDQTYGGGRYLDIDKSEIQNDEVWLDFNKAYNPWCAYAAGYACVVPPVDNDLDMVILAGESMSNLRKDPH